MLMDAQSSGKLIKADTTGNPVAIDPPPPALVDLVAAKRKKISDACESAIISGFEFSSLGEVHRYPSDRDDQLNLSGTIQRSQLPLAQPDDVYPFKCSLNAAPMLFRPHSAAQIQQVGADAYNAIVSARVKTKYCKRKSPTRRRKC